MMLTELIELLQKFLEDAGGDIPVQAEGWDSGAECEPGYTTYVKDGKPCAVVVEIVEGAACSVCGEFVPLGSEGFSSYCGTYCDQHWQEHLEDCEICRED